MKLAERSLRRPARTQNLRGLPPSPLNDSRASVVFRGTSADGRSQFNITDPSSLESGQESRRVNEHSLLIVVSTIYSLQLNVHRQSVFTLG